MERQEYTVEAEVAVVIVYRLLGLLARYGTGREGMVRSKTSGVDRKQ